MHFSVKDFFVISQMTFQDLMTFGIYRYRWRKEGRKWILFNDALNTFYLRLYGIRHVVKDHSDSERKPAADT